MQVSGLRQSLGQALQHCTLLGLQAVVPFTGPEDTECTEQLQEQCSRLSLQAGPFGFSKSLVTLFS